MPASIARHVIKAISTLSFHAASAGVAGRRRAGAQELTASAICQFWSSIIPRVLPPLPAVVDSNQFRLDDAKRLLLRSPLVKKKRGIVLRGLDFDKGSRCRARHCTAGVNVRPHG
jgi:hypothetical protein